MSQFPRRRQFLRLAIVCELALIPIGLLIAWLFPVGAEGQAWWPSLGQWDLRGVGIGIAATLPLVALFFVFERSTFAPLRRIREFLTEMLGPSLCACRWYDLVLIAALAGGCEEFLFRGVLQPRLGLLWSNVLFGLLHAVTPTYALLAGLLGGYLGWLLQASGQLCVPMITHGLYDFVAFAIVARRCRQRVGEPLESSPPPMSGGTP